MQDPQKPEKDPKGWPVITLWEALVMAIVPILIVAVVVLQIYHVNAYLSGFVFLLLPFAFGIGLIMADMMRNRWMHRRYVRHRDAVR